jgi:DnaJ family protein C protein 8
LDQKNKDEALQQKTPPYIHPLVKKSKNYLSENSLNICTESLGSETGSNDFLSYYTSSEDNNSYDVDSEKLNKNMYNMKKPRYFPPPLPSLTSQSQHCKSQPLQMRPHRDNGRLFLFLQVVSVPSHNNFFAKRQNGHLILKFANNDDNDDVDADDDEFEKDENVIEKTKMCSLELVVNKEVELVDKSSKWSETKKFNKFKGPNFEDVKVVQHGGSLPRSLPLINGYEYYWRNKASINITDQQNGISNKVVVSRNMNIYQASNDTLQQLFVLREKNGGEYLLHNLKCYKDSKTRRSFLFWDPCRIAA